MRQCIKLEETENLLKLYNPKVSNINIFVAPSIPQYIYIHLVIYSTSIYRALLRSSHDYRSRDVEKILNLSFVQLILVWEITNKEIHSKISGMLKFCEGK